MNVLHTGSRVSTTNGLSWLFLPDESTATYTNVGDNSEGDASSLVTKVNADPALNFGHSDWRLPTVDELKTLVGTRDDPGHRMYWSSTQYEGDDSQAWGVDFAFDAELKHSCANGYPRRYAYWVRLVRRQQSNNR